MTNVLIGCTGSVASLKLPILISELQKQQADGIHFSIKIVVTEHATHFFSMTDLPNNIPLYRDCDEWNSWSDRGDPVLHIDLAKWADIFVIAPLDANTLGKMANVHVIDYTTVTLFFNGLCDNLLTCIARAWEFKKPLLVCPAMNTKMWEHPVTQPQLEILQQWGCKLVPCVSKTLICGDEGFGAMAEVETIIQYVKSFVFKTIK